MEIALGISEGLARNVLAAKVDGEVWGIAMRPIHTGFHDSAAHTGTIRKERQQYGHSSAHLMAEAIEQLYRGVKFGIGPEH